MQLGLPFDVVPATSLSAAVHVYYVRHRRARRYILRVDLDGRLRITIPRGGSERDAEKFARSQGAWIARQRARLPNRAPLSLARALQVEAARDLPPRLLALAGLHGLQVSRVSIRNQRARWGSCSRNGHICLNWRLLLMPEWVRDYVLVHELMHLKRMDHSAAFWALVRAAYPRWLAARAWLRVHGSSLR